MMDKFTIGSRNVSQKYTMVPYVSPRLTPNATPKAVSTVSSPKGFSAAVSPKMASGATSPTKRTEGQVPYSPWYPSSQLSSATSSPPRGRPLSGNILIYFNDSVRGSTKGRPVTFCELGTKRSFVLL